MNFSTGKEPSVRKVNKRYLPKSLSPRDRVKQYSMLAKSKKLYKKGQYYARKPVRSFTSKPSKHVQKAKQLYQVDSLSPTVELSQKTGCSIESLQKIINKGEGAYYSSGSRPNQTAQSWGIARLASALTGGKAGAVDYHILQKGCHTKSIGLQMAQLSRKKYGTGMRRAPKVTV